MDKSRKGHEEKEDLEAIQRRKFRAKCRFRAIVRLALANAYWLTVDMIPDDKRRLQNRRQPNKPIKKLRLQDKALLNKPAHLRTLSEKKYIYRIFDKLNCFTTYPNKVRRFLAGLSYYKYYEPGRVIFRQGHTASAMYFVVSGTVVYSHKVFDDFLMRDTTEELDRLGPGSTLGDKSLLHKCPRSVTCTTIDHCEFLMLNQEDFHTVISDTVQREWDDIVLAMSNFTYFQRFDEFTLREACLVAKLKRFKHGETILGDAVGFDRCVYFQLNGHCSIIEHLNMIVTERSDGRVSYKLFEVEPENESAASEDIYKKYSLDQSSGTLNTYIDKAGSLSTANMGPSQSRSINKAKSSSAQTASSLKTVHSSDTELKKANASDELSFMGSIKRHRSFVSKMVRINLNNDLNSSHFFLAKSEDEDMFQRYSRRESLSDRPLRKKNLRVSRSIQTFFMQVCEYFPLASFNFGENMKDRRIVVLSDELDCLIIPKVWLLKNNPVNIWNRILFFLNRRLPTKQQMFEKFLEQRRWDEYRAKMVDDFINAPTTPPRTNFTSYHDVPYSLRLEEMYDT